MMITMMMMMVMATSARTDVRRVGEISRSSEALKTHCCPLSSWVGTTVKVACDQLDQVFPPWIAH